MARLKALGEQYRRNGYLMLNFLLWAEGLVFNRKCTYRLYAQREMEVWTKRREKLVRPQVPVVVPARLNVCLSMHFVHDQLSDSRCIRIRASRMTARGSV